MKIILNPNERMLIELNTFIHRNNKMFEYHMKHINLVKKYALILNKKLNMHLNNNKLIFCSLAHDILKERSLNPEEKHKDWKNLTIPQDVNRYVRTNLDILEKFGLDDYFNSSCQFHSLAAGIFLYKELDIRDNEILYPVMFHSCPIISIYKTLPSTLQDMIDIIMLSDKLSSNYLKINYKKSKVRVDLDQIVFGNNGRELNYSMGLYVARLLSQGKNNTAESIEATKFYYERLNNPLITEDCNIKKLGGTRLWQQRKSQVLTMH